jgi:MFS family permease
LALPETTTISTAIPSRLDRLPWSRFHLLLIIALGVTWMLDGLEVTIVGAMGGVLQSKDTLHLSSAEIGEVASCYVSGAVIGALGFGWLTDRFGRQKIFFATLGLYMLGAALTAMSWNFASFAMFRFLTGTGIGGEYAAVNSAIDEMMPARLRGRLDLAINGTYWVGAAAGAGATLVLLDPRLLPVDLGWRLGFGTGAVFAAGIILLRRFVPESPRWLVTHGHAKAAEAAMDEIEARATETSAGRILGPTKQLKIHARKSFGVGLVARVMLGQYRARSFLVFVLMTAQAFLYNALFFTYALVLVHFYHVDSQRAGLYLIPLAAGNFLGPVLLGRLFDTVGRKIMIAGTFGLTGILLALSGYLFAVGLLDAVTQTVAWCVIFFFASTASSAAYLTASEIFPLEMRALAIAVFYALGTAAGGIVGPSLFGMLIDTGSRWMLFYGYLAAGGLMIFAAVIGAIYGISAENQSLEDIAAPLSAQGGN